MEMKEILKLFPILEELITGQSSYWFTGLGVIKIKAKERENGQ